MVTIITKPCQLCGATSEVEVTETELAAIEVGIPMQNALPARDADFRELIISGTHPECWTQMFGEPEED